MLGEPVQGGAGQTYCGGGQPRGLPGHAAHHPQAGGGRTGRPRSTPGDDQCSAGDQWCADSIVQRTLGGITHDTISWQNRPTYQQVVEFPAHR